MKKFLTVMTAFLAAAVVAGGDILLSELQLLKAPEMEYGVGKALFWVPMKQSPAGCRLEWAETGPAPGTRSLRIDYTGAEQGPPARWFQRAQLAGDSGKLELSGQCRIAAGKSGGRVVLTFYIRGGKDVAVEAASFRTTDGNWKSFSRNLSIPANAVAVFVALEGAAGTDIAYGNVTLKQTGINQATFHGKLGSGDTLVVPAAAGTVAVDGNLSDWEGVPFVRLGDAATYDSAMNIVEEGTAQGDLKTFGGRFGCQWSKEYFYVAAEIRDPNFPYGFPRREIQYWAADSIQVAFSPGAERTVEKFAPRDTAMSFLPETDTLPPLICFDTPAPSDEVKKKIRFRFLKTAGGYTFEAAIPAELAAGSAAIAPDTATGFNLVVNNNDGKGRQWLEWAGGLSDPNWPWLSRTRNPSKFGIALTVGSQKNFLAGYFLKPDGVITDDKVAAVDLVVAAAADAGEMKIRGTIDGRHPFEFTMPVQAGINRRPLNVDTPALSAGEHQLAVSGTGNERTFETRCTLEIVPMAANIGKVREESIALERKLAELRTLLEQCRGKGADTRVPDASAAMSEVFVDFARHDVFTPDYNAKAAAYLDYCDKLISGRIEEAKQVLAGKAAYPVIPDPSMKDIVGRDGRLWSGGEPVFLNGYCTGRKVELPEIFARLGVNTISVPLNPSDGMRSESEPVKEYVRDFLRPVLAMCDQYNFTSFWLLTHSLKGELKQSLLKAHPRIADGAGNFCDYDIDNPAVRELWRNFLRESLPGLDLSRIFAFDLQNEAGWKYGSALTVAKFREWLKEKYSGDIARLQANWGPGAPADFGAVRGFPHPGEKGAGRYYDWCEFNCDRVADHLAFLKQEIVRYAPGKGFSVKVAGENQFAGTRKLDGKTQDHTNANDGLDREKLAKILTIHGCDVRPVARNCWGSKDYAFEWLGSAMTFDLMKSLAPEQLIMDNEWHSVDTVFYRNRDIAPGHIVSALWHARLHGLSACILWFWGRGDKVSRNPFFFEGSILEQPWLVEAFSQTNLLHRRFVREISAFAQAERPLAILYSEASAVHDPEYLDELQRAFEGMNFLGLPLRFLTEKQLANAEFDGIKLLVLPRVSHLDPAALKALDEAKRRGIVLMAGGEETPLRDPWSNPLPGKLPDPVRIAGGTPEAYFEAVRNILSQAGIRPGLEALDAASGLPAWGIETRTVSIGGDRYAYVLNLFDRDIPVRLRWNCRDAAPVDLVGGDEIPETPTVPGRGVFLIKY